MPRTQSPPKWTEPRPYKDAHRYVKNNRYVSRYVPEHPDASYKDNRWMILEHRLEMELYLGRFLEKFETVHHLDGDRQNNQIENLELCSHSEHISAHRGEQTKRTALINDPETIALVRQYAEDYSKKIKDLPFSPPTTYKILKKYGIEWKSNLSREYLTEEMVEKALHELPRSQVHIALGCSVQHLWNHFPELMNKTANRKLKKQDGYWGASECRKESEP